MKKKVIVYVFAVIALLLAACGKSTAEKWQEQYDLGQQYLLEEKYEEAIVAFTAAIEIDPKQADAYIGRGDAYLLSGETEEILALALADYQTALELDGTKTAAYLGIADIYVSQGDYSSALEVLETGLSQVNESSALDEKIQEIQELIQENSAEESSSGESSTEAADSGANSPFEPSDGSLGGTLAVRDFSYEYLEGGVESGGVIFGEGRMHISCTIEGPENLRGIAIYVSDDLATLQGSELEEIVAARLQTPYDTYEEQPPFTFEEDIEIYLEDSGLTLYVLLIGVDEAGNAVDYAIFPVEVPDIAPEMEGVEGEDYFTLF